MSSTDQVYHPTTQNELVIFSINKHMSNTPITAAVDKAERKFNGEDYFPAKMREHARSLEKENGKLLVQRDELLERLRHIDELVNDLFPLAIVHMASYNRSSDEKTWNPVHREIYERAIAILGEETNE